MRKLPLLAAAALLVALSGCADSHDSIMSQMIAKIGELNDTLDTVTDKASAEAAAPKLKAISEDMQALKKRADEVGEPSADRQKALEEKYKEPMEKEASRLMANMMRIGMNPEIAPTLQEAMQGMEGF